MDNGGIFPLVQIFHLEDEFWIIGFEDVHANSVSGIVFNNRHSGAPQYTQYTKLLYITCPNVTSNGYEKRREAWRERLNGDGS